MELNKIADIIKEKDTSYVLEVLPDGLQVEPLAIKDVCDVLFRHPSLLFDSLSCLTGIDNGPDLGTMEVVYHLYSITNNIQLNLKCEIQREAPVISSVTSIWKAADWHEREAYDLVGIRFEGHPDLRRILLPADWEGHPLQKDYQEQEFYHGIKVGWEQPEDASDDRK